MFMACYNLPYNVLSAMVVLVCLYCMSIEYLHGV
jgi:hypothetical protein